MSDNNSGVPEEAPLDMPDDNSGKIRTQWSKIRAKALAVSELYETAMAARKAATQSAYNEFRERVSAASAATTLAMPVVDSSIAIAAEWDFGQERVQSEIDRDITVQTADRASQEALDELREMAHASDLVLPELTMDIVLALTKYDDTAPPTLHSAREMYRAANESATFHGPLRAWEELRAAKAMLRGMGHLYGEPPADDDDDKEEGGGEEQERFLRINESGLEAAGAEEATIPLVASGISEAIHKLSSSGPQADGREEDWAEVVKHWRSRSDAARKWQSEGEGPWGHDKAFDKEDLALPREFAWGTTRRVTQILSAGLLDRNVPIKIWEVEDAVLEEWEDMQSKWAGELESVAQALALGGESAEDGEGRAASGAREVGIALAWWRSEARDRQAGMAEEQGSSRAGEEESTRSDCGGDEDIYD